MAEKQTILDWALCYHSQGWSIIPIEAGTKKPALKSWKQYQTERPDEKQLRKWFCNGKYTSLAVICGAVSGGLAVLDLDSEERCQWWRNTYPELAKTLPTAKTKKGLHVHFRSEPFPKRNGDKVDLLCEGACAIVPPSPEKQWLIPLNGELPLLNPFEWGLEQFDITAPQKEQPFTEDTEEPEDTEDIERQRNHKLVGRELASFDSETIRYIKMAIEKTIPQKLHTRNNNIFVFCQWLKGIKEIQGLRAAELKPIVKLWWEKARSNIYTKPFTTTYADFVHAWKRVEWPKGDVVVEQAVKKALEYDKVLPELQQYADEPDIVFLATILREMQKLMGKRPIFLASRKAAGIIGVSHTQILKWFELLEEDGILNKVQEHTECTADRYRYVAG